MKNLLTKEQTCKRFGCTMEQLNNQYAENAKGIDRLYQKAIATGKKVNGFTSIQLQEMKDNYLALAK